MISVSPAIASGVNPNKKIATIIMIRILFPAFYGLLISLSINEHKGAQADP